MLYLSCSQSNGDGGVDIIGCYKRHTLLVQCKDIKDKVSCSEIRAFRTVMDNYSKNATLGVFVTSKKNHYSSFAIDEAQEAIDLGFKLILTNIHNISRDIPNYELYDEDSLVIKKIEENFLIQEEIKKKIEEQGKKIEGLQEKDEKAENRDNIIICLLFFLIILLIVNIILTLMPKS
jgi:hypothetical protein